MIDDAAWSRIARYLAGECTPQEAATIREWIDKDGERRALFDMLAAAWQGAGAPPPARDSRAAWERLNARLLRPERVSVAIGDNNRISRAWRFGPGAVGAAMAAALVVAVGLPLGLRAARSHPPVLASVPTADREYRTAPGQRAIVNLVDGTRVELGVESLLRVRTTNGRTREVTLEGEAAFTVVHDSTRPFLVYARNAITEDLGTRFNIRAYPSDPGVRVVVMTGEVALGPGGARRTILEAGDEAALDSAGAVRVSGNADTAATLAWTRERFVARALPLRDVARQLERWFDVKIDIRDSAAASERVTIDVAAARLTDVLGAATAPLGLLYTQDGHSVAIRRARTGDPDTASIRRSPP